jgi:hypothetical protein
VSELRTFGIMVFCNDSTYDGHVDCRARSTGSGVEFLFQRNRCRWTEILERLRDLDLAKEEKLDRVEDILRTKGSILFHVDCRIVDLVTIGFRIPAASTRHRVSKSRFS